MLDPRVRTRPDITLLNASGVLVEEGRLPSRIVLYKEKNGTKGREQWIVHTERLQFDGDGFKHWAFDHGDYCSSLERAEAKFAERAAAL